jgi:uncharacterized protein (TIGR00369 family)
MDPVQLKSAGWTTIEVGGFSGQVGLLWVHGTGADSKVGFFAEARHTNNHIGTVHGGALMTFADIALGYAVVQALGASNCATAQLQTHFVAAAKSGDFISCKPEVIRRSSQLVFMRGLIAVGEKTIASVDGIWKVLEARSPAA